MLQLILVVVLFAAAVGYAGRLVWRSFFGKTACASGCSKCGAVDFKEIEQQLKQRGI